MKTRLGIALAAASVALVAGCSSGSGDESSSAPASTTAEEASSTFTVDGSVVIINTGMGDTAQARLTRVKEDDMSLDCEGANEYAFVREGESVTVRDAEGKTVGLGRLGPGLDRTPPKDGRLECAFAFTVPDVPESAFYSVQFGSEDPIQYTAEELRSGIAFVLE